MTDVMFWFVLLPEIELQRSVDRKLGFCGALRAPQNPKSWISKALCAFEIQLLD
jgi:hypothetical protein